MTTSSTPLLSICCVTYNHESYIRDAINGFLMQQVDFPIEIVVHDDASTDGTPDIIREYAAKYPDTIVPIFQTENQYSKGKKPFANFAYPRARGKYIALCEGDDYWTDPKKLQIQVDYMEAHPECRISFHRSDVIDERMNLLKSQRDYDLHVSLRQYLHFECFVATSSVVFRAEKTPLPAWFKEFQASGDWQLYAWLLRDGVDFHFIDSETMSVYRKHSSSVTASLRDNSVGQIDARLDRLQLIIDDYYLGRRHMPYLHSIVAVPMLKMYVRQIRLFVQKNDYRNARKRLHRALRLLPWAYSSSNAKKMLKLLLHVDFGLLKSDRIMS